MSREIMKGSACAGVPEASDMQRSAARGGVAQIRIRPTLEQQARCVRPPSFTRERQCRVALSVSNIHIVAAFIQQLAHALQVTARERAADEGVQQRVLSGWVSHLDGCWSASRPRMAPARRGLVGRVTPTLAGCSATSSENDGKLMAGGGEGWGFGSKSF